MELERKRILGYWIIALFFSVVFGEVITGIISNNPVFFQNAVPITVYYGIICLVFGFLFSRIRYWIVLIIIFIYGGLAEVLFFKGIGIFIVAGIFYVFLFGVPYWITTKIWRK